MKRSVPSMWSIWFREQRERPLWFFAELVLLIGILAMPCIGVHMVGAKAQEIRVIESRSSDYIFDNDKHGNTGVDEERLNRLKDIYGVSEVRAWHRLQMSSNEISESMLIDLSAYLDDEAVALSFALREEFLQARSEEIQQQIEWADPDSDSGKRERKALEKDLQANENALQALQDGYYPLDFYSTSDETELRKILRNLEAGAITEEEFLSGEKAVLPPGAVAAAERSLWRYLLYGECETIPESGGWSLCKVLIPGRAGFGSVRRRRDTDPGGRNPLWAGSGG